MARQLYTARLKRRLLLSERAACFHLEFAVDGLEQFAFEPGQFVSFVAHDDAGKQQTRAYSLASAHDGNKLDLGVNRVEGGFFANYLAELPIGHKVTLHGPHGYFVLQQPVTDSLFVAADTGIAPIRSFLQWLFPDPNPETRPDAGLDRSEGKDIWLVYGASHESNLYYHEEFEALAARHPNFHYFPTLSHAGEEWRGLCDDVQECVAKIIEERAARLGIPLPVASVDPSIPRADLRFDIYAYVCGLNEMVPGVREKLAGYNRHKKQIIFERYD